VDGGGAAEETDAESGEAEAALQESGRRDGENTGELGMATVQDMARASRAGRTRSSVAAPLGFALLFSSSICD
jgi:hypothetical protein